MRRLCAVSLSLVALLQVAGAAGARAQIAVGEQQPALRVARISPFTDATHPFSVTVQVLNAGEVALTDGRIRITTRGRVNTRSELREALDRGARTGQVRSTEQRISEAIPPGGQVAVTVERRPEDLGLTRSGVYPVEVTLHAGANATTLRTAIPHFGSEPQHRLNVAWVITVQRPAVAPIEGIYPRGTIERLRLEELAQQAEAIAARPEAPVTLAVSGALLDTLADLADGFGHRTEGGIEAVGEDDEEALSAARALDALQRAAGAAGELATAPYAPANLPSLPARGLGGDILRQVTLGRSAGDATLGRAPSTSVLVPPGGQISAQSVAPLRRLGVEATVLDARALTRLEDGTYRANDFGPSRPITVRAGSSARDGTVAAVLPDAPLAARLESGEQTVLLAQALVAESASSWHELPLFAGERVLTIAATRMPAPTVLAAALDAFEAAPWVRLRTITGALAAAPPQGDPVTLRSFAPNDALHLQAARAARRALAALQEILAGPLPAADTYERHVLIAESAEWYRDPRAGASIARAVAADVGAALGNITVARDRRVTLTARSGEVPVTLVNENDFPVQVRVRVLSPRLGFPEGTSHTVAGFTGATTVDVPVVARATGSYPVEVRIETPDGTRTLASGRLVLRTTAVSKVTLLAVGGGALLLIVTGFRPRNGRAKRERRGRRRLVRSP